MVLFANQQESKRPTFITIVCILSFMVNGFSFVSNMTVYNDPAQETQLLLTEMQQQQVSYKNATGDPATKQQLLQILDAVTHIITSPVIKKMALFSAIAAFVCLLGTSLMWRMKKSGFHFFIVGTLIGVLSTFILFGGNGVSLFIAVIMNLIWLFLLSLFAVNLKFLE
jgi:hypothetical protein